jgi:mannosyl-oligosaccharide alpha-1,2-mannosidase
VLLACRCITHFSCRFDEQEDINVFETNIRVVGGLLGAYELSRDSLFLDKARELVDRLMIAFDT